MTEKPLTAREVAEKLGPTKFMRLCSKVTTEAHQKFDVLSIKELDGRLEVEVVLEKGQKKTVVV